MLQQLAYPLFKHHLHTRPVDSNVLLKLRIFWLCTPGMLDSADNNFAVSAPFLSFDSTIELLLLSFNLLMPWLYELSKRKMKIWQIAEGK